MPRRKALPTLSFRHFLNGQEVAGFLQKLVAARPEKCRLETLGASRQGRDIPLLVVTDFAAGAPEDKPAYLIQANIHATEVAGTHMALYTARQLLAEQDDLLQQVAFYIVPRLNPDGAEYAVNTGGRVRSRIKVDEPVPNNLYPEDVDGDGLILTMRQEHANGTFVADPQDGRLLVRRRVDSVGPFYRVLPEGYIHQWDGGENIGTGGRSFDWNRNWSYDWRPEPEQHGAGDFPFSEIEMHHLGTFLHSRPNLFGLLGYHTGPAAVLRPPSTGADSDLDEADVHVMEELANSASEATGFPVVPVVKYHRLWQRDNNLRGHFHNFCYHHLGLFAFEFELGTIKDSAGIDTDEQFEVFTEDDADEQMRQVMQWWDQQKAWETLFRPWKKFQHPQLGEVEVGSFLAHHLANPTLSSLQGIARGTYQFTVEHAQQHPRVVLEDLQVEAVGDKVYRIRVRVANRGVLPTHVTNKGKGLRRLPPVRVEFHAAKSIVLSQRAHHELGHLAGVTGGKLLEWFVEAGRGKGAIGEICVYGGTGGNLRQVVEKPS
jgi:hypothetical protein